MKSQLTQNLEDYIIENQELFYRLAYSYVKNPDNALDIVQDSIYKAFTSINSLKNPSYMKTWLYRIIVNTSIDFIRRNKREVIMDNDILLSIDKGIMDKYSDFDLKVTIDNLPENYKSIIILRFFEDLKINDIANILDENVNTIKTRLYKSLEVLRLSMDDNI